MELEKSHKIQYKHLSSVVENSSIKYGRKLLDGRGPTDYAVCIARDLKVGGDDFIRCANKIIKEIDDESNEILSIKQSHFNPNVFMHECNRCGTKELKKLITHHREHQSEAVDNMINGYHKNSKWNLEVLCVDCHFKEHHDDHHH